MNLEAKMCLLLAGLFPLCGCVHLRQSREARQPAPEPLPAAAVALVAKPPKPVVVLSETELATNRHYRVIRIVLAHPENSGATNTLDYYQLPNGRRPVILLLPMAGGRRYQVEGFFARYFAQRDIAVVIAHRRRIAREFKLDAIDPWLLETIQDNVRALDWIETRPELDADRIGLFGISLGGIRGVLLTGLDRRVKAAALGLAGGDLAHVAAYSDEPGAARRRKDYMLKHDLTAEQLKSQLREAISFEPNDFAAHIDPQKVLLVLACFDQAVPFAKGWELRARLGKPETLLLPTGHYTAALAIPTIQWESLQFFRDRLDIGPPIVQANQLRAPRDASN
jgi:hypothetical protein